MRSTLLLAALAAGAVDAFEKRVYVTDWTTVTVTKTVTAPAVTLTVPPVQQNQQPLSTSPVETSSTTAPAAPQESQAAPQVSQPPTVAVADNSDNSDNSELAKKSPAPEPAPQEGATTWFSAWTTTWGAEQPASTLETASSTASEPAATPSTHYETTVLYNHNVHRSNHSAASVAWDKKLEESARKLAKTCVYQHDTSIDGGGYGQNIGYGTSADDVGIMLTNEMYNDEFDIFPWSSYKTKPDMRQFKKWGHFSQMVWKATTHVGCATVTCDHLGGEAGVDNSPFTVCNYSPPGNMDDEYPKNISPGGGAGVYAL